MFTRTAFCFLAFTFATALFAAEGDSPPRQEKHFKIKVVDDETGRGVPLVELRTVNDVTFVTDSAGIVAFHEPGLMDQTVFFHVTSHGYEFPKDGFGIRGTRLTIKPGGEATLRIRRINIAERLYRITGAGIYRDSILLGEQPPTKHPVLNGQVLGSDSVVNAIYSGKIHWFWGDTNRPSYPLGNFHVPGATSRLPVDGGLDPEIGVDLDYFVDASGFAKATAKMPGKGPTWINGLIVLKDKGSGERMFATYVKVEPPLTIYERGLAEFNDEKKEFEKLVEFQLGAPVFPHGHPFLHKVDGVEYIYFADPLPNTRVRAIPDDLRNLSKYESYSCFTTGSRADSLELDRDDKGRLRYAWKRDTLALSPELQSKLIKDGRVKENEAWCYFRDVESDKPVLAHRGTVAWNDFRNHWVMIFTQTFGTSLLGEVWFAEAESLMGPWTRARKIVTHDKYSFYNPKHHPMFDKDGGRIVFFEGTYTNTFSGNNNPTPRYNYNQIMYKLDLSDPRLKVESR